MLIFMIIFIMICLVILLLGYTKCDGSVKI